MKKLCILFCFLSICVSAFAADVSKKVDEHLAYTLMKDAGHSADEIMPADDPSSSDHPSTQSFWIAHKLGKYGGTAGWYAVNPWTGDIWGIDGNCQLLSTPFLLKAQVEIKKQFRGEEIKEYPRLHALRPYRMRDLEPCGPAEN